MLHRMEFPNTIKEFIDSFSFKDSEEVYTNGVELIPVFRVEQALEHYEKKKQNKTIDEFAGKMIIMMPGHKDDILLVAEQMKAGGEDE